MSRRNELPTCPRPPASAARPKPLLLLAPQRLIDFGPACWPPSSRPAPRDAGQPTTEAPRKLLQVAAPIQRHDASRLQAAITGGQKWAPSGASAPGCLSVCLLKFHQLDLTRRRRAPQELDRLPPVAAFNNARTMPAGSARGGAH